MTITIRHRARPRISPRHKDASFYEAADREPVDLEKAIPVTVEVAPASPEPTARPIILQRVAGTKARPRVPVPYPAFLLARK